MNWFAIIAVLLGAACIIMGVTGSYANVWSFITGVPTPIPGGIGGGSSTDFGTTTTQQQTTKTNISTGLQTHQAN